MSPDRMLSPESWESGHPDKRADLQGGEPLPPTPVQGKVFSPDVRGIKDCCPQVFPDPSRNQWPTSFKMFAQGERVLSALRTDQS